MLNHAAQVADGHLTQAQGQATREMGTRDKVLVTIAIGSFVIVMTTVLTTMAINATNPCSALHERALGLRKQAQAVESQRDVLLQQATEIENRIVKLRSEGQCE